MIRVRFVIPRTSSDEFTYAVVSAAVKSEAMLDERVFLVALSSAVNKWTVRIASGRAAWRESRKDFNVGDLSRYLADKELQKCLSLARIYDMEITIATEHNRAKCWTYDTILAGPNRRKR